MYFVFCYRAARRKPVEYTETVEPMSIARRLMEIREQVAEQLSADLEQMTAENDRLQEEYQYEVNNTKNELLRPHVAIQLCLVRISI